MSVSGSSGAPLATQLLQAMRGVPIGKYTWSFLRPPSEHWISKQPVPKKSCARRQTHYHDLNDVAARQGSVAVVGISPFWKKPLAQLAPLPPARDRDRDLGLAEPVALDELHPQAFTADHFETRVSRTPAASNR